MLRIKDNPGTIRTHEFSTINPVERFSDFPKIDRTNSRKYFEILVEKINHDLSVAVSTEFPPNLYNPMRYVLSTKGKRLRPVLLIMASESVGGKLENAYYASLAIEILHNFTLVHDDIMDDDELRRGRQTVHTKWNESIAILAGDGLIALAYRYLLLTKSRHIRNIIKIFSEAIINICEGQSIDKDMEEAEQVSLEDYLYMIGRKTGVLMGVSAELGGILGKGSEKQVNGLKKFGLDLGTAFQIQDDLLDIISDQSVIGKDLGSDLAQGKKTYPILLLLDRASPRDAEKARKTLAYSQADSGGLKQIQKMIYKYDIVNTIKREVDILLDRANSHLKDLSSSAETGSLMFLSDIIRNRQH
ncbi:polyprenyl synthetase family protein [candidate division KSB1 bacterium]